MGWNRTVLTDDGVKLTFNFTDTRLFYNVDIHTNNMFTKDVQVFLSLLRVLFLNQAAYYFRILRKTLQLEHDMNY